MTFDLAHVTAHGRALRRYAHLHPPRLHVTSWRPYVGIVGVLLGGIMGTLSTRTSSFGLADLRGALHAGFDEGAWITSTFGIAQMVVGVACPYLGAIFGARRVLLLGMTLFFVSSLLAPLTHNLTGFFAMMILGGLGSGTFIPLTISFVIRSLPAQLVVYGIAIYAMNSELSQNVAASLEGWYAESLSWHWIYWQHCVLVPPMFVAVLLGIPRERVNLALLRDLDWFGLLYAATGFGLLYAALDQGNRLDWRSSGLIVGLFCGGGLLTVAFVGRELTTNRPFLNLRLLLRGNLLPLLLLLAGFRFIILSTAYIIPTYLQAVQNFRELQVGQVLLWIAVPQLVIALPLAALLRRIDGRITLGLGTASIAVACLLASRLTSVWATDDFLPSQVLQALGQCFALTSLIVLIVRITVPEEALTIGCLLQISRLFGGEIGTAFMQTLVRVREQVHSNLIGLHVRGGDLTTADRVAAYAARLGSQATDPAVVAGQASRLLSQSVTTQASVLAYADGFTASAAGAFGCLVLVALMRRGPRSAI